MKKETFLLLAGLLASLAFSRAAAEDTSQKSPAERIVRVQVFLDRAGFGPGKIDGKEGEFTRRALELYRRSIGQDVIPGETLDAGGLDLSTASSTFITYTVTEEDLQNVGEMPAEVPAQAKLQWLPYASPAEAVAERFHCDIDFLEELNPGKTKTLKAGDHLTVPNVEPFDLAAIKRAKTTKDNPKSDASPTPSPVSIVVDTKTNMLSLYENDKIVGAFPVTIGSTETESPVGEWKVKGVARLPEFRYDEKMLNEGQRSQDFHMLPPGPNNPVGVIWIALNKDGIGLHGTSDPDLIGRSQSHGCIRLANWDVARLAAKVSPGVPVSVR